MFPKSGYNNKKRGDHLRQQAINFSDIKRKLLGDNNCSRSRGPFDPILSFLCIQNRYSEEQREQVQNIRFLQTKKIRESTLLLYQDVTIV